MSFVKRAKYKVGLLVDNLRSNPPVPPASKLVQSESSGHGYTYARPRAPPTAGETASSAIIELLAAAHNGSDLCLPLKAALVVVVKVWDICKRTNEVKDEYEKLESRLAHLSAVTGAYGKRGHLDASLKQRLDSIAISLERLAACVEAKLERGTTKRVLESNGDVAEVKDLLVKISALIEAFLYESMIRVEIRVDAILSRLPTVEERELKKELAIWNGITQNIASTLGTRRVHEAGHDSQPKEAGCMPGTRVRVLSKFLSWVKEDSKSIFWLAGMAGTGKTSVVVTLCRMLAADPDVLLGGAFFCSRTTNVEARTEVRRILPTLSVMLANQSPAFAAALAAELQLDSAAAAHKPVSDQICALLQRPLAALASDDRPIVFVIDALDECNDERELAELLTAIAAFRCEAKVKFILSSRPETQVHGSPISDQTRSEIIQLHMIDAAEVTADIRLYIDAAFSDQPLVRPWYSEADVIQLATLSGSLFIFASTIVAYVLKVQSVTGRAARLQTALTAVRESRVALGPLNAIYKFVLTRASDSTEVEPKELKAALQVLASILIARMPLSVSALADLLGRETDELRDSLRRLQAVVHVPGEDDQPGLRIVHASFATICSTILLAISEFLRLSGTTFSHVAA